MAARRRSFGRKKRNFSRVLILTALFFGVVFVWANAETTSPPVALSQAMQHLASEEWDQAEPLLSIAARHTALKPWALLASGQSLEKRGKRMDALAAYKQISPESAASLDAQVAVLRIEQLNSQLGDPKKRTDSNPDLEKLFSTAKQLSRNDLLPEILFLQAHEAESRHQESEALKLYTQIRRDYPEADIVERARSSTLRIRSAQSGTENPVEVLTEEAELLLNEKELLAALDKIQQARNLIEDKAEQNKKLLIEEQILRKLKRNTEADELLLRISADGGLGSADIALLRIAKNAWNINDHHRALEVLEMLNERYPKSPQREEGLYVEARILEELNLFVEARDTYQRLSDIATQPLSRGRALKRIGWLYLISSDPAQAAKRLSEALKVFSEAIEPRATEIAPGTGPKMDIKTARELFDESLHSKFWLAECLSKLSPDQRPKSVIGAVSSNPTELWQQIAKEAPSHYYAYLSRKRLELPAEKDAGSAAGEPCKLLDLNSTVEIVRHFGPPDLKFLAQREIDWAFFRSARSLEIPIGKPTPELVQNLLSFGSISEEYGQTSSGIRVAERLASSLERNHFEAAVEGSCKPLLRRLRFPTPYRDALTQAAKQKKIPPEFMFALARSESYFDPYAKSVVGALGLVQLMPETAKRYGLRAGEELFVPEVNLRISAAYLAKLMSQFNSEPAYVAAAYNAGEGAVDRWQSRYPQATAEMWIELIGYPETHKYVKNVLVAQDVYRGLIK